MTILILGGRDCDRKPTTRGASMSPSEESEKLAQEEAEASLDSALNAESEHSEERAAHHRQGLIEKGTREHHLDEG